MTERIVESMENGVYKSIIDGVLMLTITDLGNNIFRAVNKSTDMTAEIIPLDDYRTKTRCIEHKNADKMVITGNQRNL